MGITYRIDTALRIVFVHWQGVVTKKEYAQHLKTMLTDEEALACGRSISDVREATDVLFKYNDIQQLVEMVIMPLLGERRWKNALIVKEPALYGVVRQFQSITDELIEISIFTDEASAFQWITQ